MCEWLDGIASIVLILLWDTLAPHAFRKILSVDNLRIVKSKVFRWGLDPVHLRWLPHPFLIVQIFQNLGKTKISPWRNCVLSNFFVVGLHN